jgi:CDGSH-type Zn-finger protein
MPKPESPQGFPYSTELAPGDYWWCACGKSKSQPFCDGSHKTTNFEPVTFSITENKTYQLCGCKNTKTPPFCDGSHNKA